MEGTGSSKLPYSITADPLMNLKEETPGVILSNVDLVTPVYSLVPSIKLEPESENTLQKVVHSEIVNTDINGCESSFSDKGEIETKEGCIETILGQETVLKELASPRVTNNLIPYFLEDAGALDVKFQSLPEVGAGENEDSDFKYSHLKHHLAAGLESCSDNALFKVPEYPPLNVTEVNNGTADSILNRKLRVATIPKTEPSLEYNPCIRLVDVFANPLGASASSEMIEENCGVSVVPSASETIIGSCNLPLLPDKNSLNPKNPESLGWSQEHKATDESADFERVTSQFSDSIKKKCMAKKLKKVVKKQPAARSSARLKGNEQTSKVLRDSANILNLPASKKCVTRLNSQRKGIGLPFKSSSKNLNILTSLNPSPGIPIPSTCMHTAGNSLKSTQEPPKIFVSRRRQAEDDSLRKHIKKTESKNISVEANFILDSPVQTEESGKASEIVAAKNDTPGLNNEETLSPSSDVSDESNLLADTPVEAAEGSTALENIALENNTPPNVNDEESLSASNDVPKLTLFNKEQLKERNESLGAVVFDKTAKNTAAFSLPPINNREVSSVNVKKLISVFKQKKRKVESLNAAANCTEDTKNSVIDCAASNTSSEKTSLSIGGNPKPILISIEQWKKTPGHFIPPKLRYDKMWQKHTIFANQKVRRKSDKTCSSEGKPSNERLYFIKGKGWACERCEQIFQKSRQLKSHKKGCYVDRIPCSNCPRIFETIGHFTAHLRFCQNPVYKCPDCPKVFRYEYQYDYHYLMYHGKEYVCADCVPPRNFRNKNVLRNHIYKYHKAKPKRVQSAQMCICTDCTPQRNFTDKKTLYRHIKDEHKLMTCNACGKVLRRDKFKNHMRSHDRKKLVCIHCGLHFTALRSLQNHWKTHNDTGNPAAKMCIWCGKFFGLKTELVKHLKEHESERSFICEHCGKGFFRHDHLDTHLLSHKEKQFICPKCNRGFVLKHQLAAHRRTIACGDNNALTSSKKRKVVKTNKEKPKSVPKQQFTCANCDKGFSSKRQLIIHLSTFLCGKNATSTLKEVDKVGRKKEVTAKLSPSPKIQFTCANCSQNFIQKRLLVAHFSSGLCSGGSLTTPNEMNNGFEASKKEKEGLRVKSENQFVCANCGISFDFKPQLIAHLNVGPCDSDVTSSGREIIQTKTEDRKKLMPESEKRFITVFEHFVHKRQLVNSVPCGKDSMFSVKEPIIRKDILKKKTEKSKVVRKNQFSCAKCGQCFNYKRQLTAHLSSVFCGNAAMSSAESTKNVIKARNKKQKLRSKPTNQFTCGKCGQCFVHMCQLAAHLRSAVCNVNVISSLKKHKNVIGTKKEEKKSKSAPGVQFVCANCNQDFIHKRKLVAHLGVGSCMSRAPTVSEKAKEGDRPETEKEETSMLTESQHHCKNCDQVFVLEAGAHICSSRNNGLPSSIQIEEAAAANMNGEKELMPILPEKQFVCGSCDNGFASKQRLNDHLCPAACCSHSLSSPIQVKNTAKVENTKEIEATSMPRRRSVCTINVVHEQQLPRSCRSFTRSSLKQTKEVGSKKDEKKILRSMSAKKQFVCRSRDQHFTFKRQLSSHMCT